MKTFSYHIGMAQVTGIGGIFFKSEKPEELYQWYEKHLGIRRVPEGGGASFEWKETHEPYRKAMTAWAIFPHQSKYFDPSRASFMINYRVDNLDQILETLKDAGVQVDPHREDYDYGRFAWITDPEGNRIELWEPPAK